ncbi:MAG: HEAT repeat domain-containing protein [Candidatus Jettenia sp.]|nr:MAG: HEAT repeat domain-containing protein [Candidatus Jettenia sp.]
MKMRGHGMYLCYALFIGAALARDIYTGSKACSETMQQTERIDTNTAGAVQPRKSFETLKAIEQYIAIVKNTGKHDRKQLYGILSHALRDDDMEIRAAVVSSLGSLGDKEVVPDLLSSLQDEELWVRLAAATALGDIGDKDVIPELIQLLDHRDVRVRESASLALGALDYEGEIPGLKDAIERRGKSPHRCLSAWRYE